MATQEERDARDLLERLKDKMEALIGQIESTLTNTPISTSALQKRIKSADKAWTEFEDQYDRLRAISRKGRTRDQVRAEQDRDEYIAFQRCYFEVHARTEDALDNEQNAEDVRLKELKNAEDVRLKALKVQQYTTRWKGVHHHIKKS